MAIKKEDPLFSVEYGDVLRKTSLWGPPIERVRVLSNLEMASEGNALRRLTAWCKASPARRRLAPSALPVLVRNSLRISTPNNEEPALSLSSGPVDSS